jgi:hypothetical protein
MTAAAEISSLRAAVSISARTSEATCTVSRSNLAIRPRNRLPSAQTLRQGRKDVGDQFSYSFLLTEERRHSVFYAVFRQSFAVAAVTA